MPYRGDRMADLGIVAVNLRGESGDSVSKSDESNKMEKVKDADDIVTKAEADSSGILEDSVAEVNHESSSLPKQSCDVSNEDQSKLQAMVIPIAADTPYPKCKKNTVSITSRRSTSGNFATRSSAHLMNSSFVDCSVPSYALPTVASQIRVRLNIENVSSEDIPVCHRYTTPSPVCHRHKRRRSRSMDNELEAQKSPSGERWHSAPHPRRVSHTESRTKRNTPVQSVALKTLAKGPPDSRPSSAKTDTSVRSSNVKTLFSKDKVASPTKPLQLSVGGSEMYRNKPENGIERPKSVSTNESSANYSTTPRSRPDTKASPEKETSSKGSFTLKPKLGEKVTLVHETKVAKEQNKNIVSLSSNKKDAGSDQNQKDDDLPADDSSLRATHDTCRTEVVKGKSNNDETEKVKSMNDDMNTSKPTNTDKKQMISAKEATGDKEISTGKTLPEKPTSSSKGPSSSSDKSVNQGKTQNVKPHTNKSASIQKESKKPPVRSKEPQSGEVKIGNKEVKETKSSATIESDKKNRPLKAATATLGLNERETSKETGLEKEKTPGTGEGSVSVPKEEEGTAIEEYRAKLAEKRKLAREKAEREAEEERLRQEQMKREKEERRLREEEEERRRDEEELRLAEESRKLEEERYRKSVEEEEQRRREEAARLEAEAKAKLEQEALARQLAERLEQERLEKKKREEEEKLERKKRLKEVMRRVKTDEPVSKVETKTTTSVQLHIVDNEAESVEQDSHSPGLVNLIQHNSVTEKTLPADDGTTRFKSPLLQQILTGRSKTRSAVSEEKTETNGSAADVINCLFEEQKKPEEPSLMVLSQETVG